MNLKTVTFTGLDDQVNLSDVVALSRQYPFIEWGVLLSLKRQGNSIRYPSHRRLCDISELPIRKSAHICGELARDVLASRVSPILYATSMVSGISRIQVNTGKSQRELWPIVPVVSKAAQTMQLEIILQCSDFSAPETFPTTGNVAFLHDGSGGRGISGSFQSPVNGDYVGYAGGINPDNVLLKLEQIEALRPVRELLGFDITQTCEPCANDFWIDMESGIRNDDDELDLEKVAKVCSLVEPFVKRDPA